MQTWREPGCFKVPSWIRWTNLFFPIPWKFQVLLCGNQPIHWPARGESSFNLEGQSLANNRETKLSVGLLLKTRGFPGTELRWLWGQTLKMVFPLRRCQSLWSTCLQRLPCRQHSLLVLKLLHNSFSTIWGSSWRRGGRPCQWCGLLEIKSSFKS